MSWNMPINLEECLLPYQRRYIADQSRFKIWVAARQVGKSTGVAFEAVLLAVSRPHTSILLVSASQRQSQELLGRVSLWTELMKVGVDKRTVIKESAQELRLENNSRLVSLPANPDTIRGFSGHIFLDEFAFHRDSQRIWAAVFPIATRGFMLRVTSTPNGKQNMFYEIWAKGGDHWGRWSTGIHEAVAQGLNVDLDLLKKATPDPDTWAQEYECRFIDEATAFLTYEMIAAVESEKAGLPARADGGPFYLGADIGRKHDLTVFWVLEKVGDVLWTREIKVLSKTSFAEQDQVMDSLFKRFKPRRICMDQSGLGEKMVEDAKSRYGRTRVEGLVFTLTVKQDLAMELRRQIEDRTIRIPADREVREDLHSISKAATASGNIRFLAKRTSDGHADRFWSLALAVHAAVEPEAAPKAASTGRRSMSGRIRGY